LLHKSRLSLMSTKKWWTLKASSWIDVRKQPSRYQTLC
jgi:hypothetical protein